MPRLFTGLEIPSDMGDALAEMRGGLPGARWIDRANYHITLRFIGDVDHGTARDVCSVLGDVHRKPVAVTLDSLSTFGGARPRAVIARVAPSAPLIELQAEQERKVRSVGVPPEGRKFTPHVTLARLRDVSPLDVADYLALRAVPAMRFTAQRFVLFSSRDSVGGGPYVIEAAYPLG